MERKFTEMYEERSWSGAVTFLVKSSGRGIMNMRKAIGDKSFLVEAFPSTKSVSEKIITMREKFRAKPWMASWPAISRRPDKRTSKRAGQKGLIGVASISFRFNQMM
jgi:hypothetical protein